MRTTAAKPPSSLAFDWMMGFFSLLIMIGVFQDGWAHNHGLVDQSFFTPWHAILYGTMAVTGIALGIAGVRNLLRGYSFKNGLPYGYWTSAIGVVIFLVGGGFDLWWHSRYGIEVDIEGLISPSHLTLAFGGMLVFAGTLRSIGAQYGPNEGRWRTIGPAVVAGVAVLMLLGFFTQYASPTGDDTLVAIMKRVNASTGSVLYSVHTDGTSETRIAAMPGSDIATVSVAPNGKRLAARIEQAGQSNSPPSDIYVMNADGSRPVRVTHSGRHDTQPAWSPNGKQIAYISIPAQTSGEYELHVMAANGSANRIVAHGTTRMLVPQWSPSGTQIAVQSRNGVTDQIAVFSDKGGSPRWIDGTQGAQGFIWRRDGAFAFERDGGIALLLPGQRSARVLVKNASSPQFSADAKRFAFTRDDAGEQQVFLANADGTNAVDVTRLAGVGVVSVPQIAGATIYFAAQGHPPATQTGIGRAYGIDAAIISSLALMGVVLLLVRRWRVPLGGITVLVGLYALAMATQIDLYYILPASLIPAVLVDICLSVLKDRARSGPAFYLLGFGMPALTFALYEYIVGATVGIGWSFPMVSGAPLIAGFAGLLAAFCFAPPLAVQSVASQQPVDQLVQSWQQTTTTL